MYEVDETVIPSDIPGYEVILQLGEWDYEWAEMRVYKRDGRLFYVTDSGCSCNSWEDWTKSEADLIELPTLEAARNAVKSFLGYGDFSGQIDTYLNAIEKFRALGLR